MRKIVAFIAIVLCSITVSIAQTRSISGKVSDASGNGIEAASVLVKGTSSGVAADAGGNFRIMAKTGDVLVFSATNFASKEVRVGSGNVVNVSLESQENTIDEVIVTALNVQRQAKQLGYSTTKIKSDELTQAKVVNLQNGLTGKVSGLNVATTNSGVFGDTRITLRGIRSLTGNNQPMLVVDGVVIPLSYLSSLNPNDIGEVSILKSSSATVVYGPDGVNGAIIVTTKKGVEGKPVITVSNTTQLESISYLPKFQKIYGGGYSQDANGNGTWEPIEQQSWGDPFDGSIRQFGQTGPNGEKLEMPYSYNKKGRRNFFETGVTNQTDVSYSTGGFYISAQNVAINGTMPGDVNKRRSFFLKSDKTYGKFRAGFNLRYTNGDYNITNNNQIVYYGVTSAPGNYDLSRFKNWRTDYFSSPDGYYTPYLDNNGKTPYFAKDNYREFGRNDDVIGNLELGLKATDWLSFTYRAGLAYSNSSATTTRGAFNYSAFHNTLRDHGTLNITSAVGQSTSNSKRFTSEFFATFKKKISDDFSFDGLLGQSFRETTGRSQGSSSNNLGNATSYILPLRKGEPAVSYGESKTRLERYFGTVSFGYKNWAFIEGTGSYDFDSRLAKPGAYSKKSDVGFFYPGVSTSIILSDAIPALKSSNVISYAKIRGAISKTGNVNLGAYAFEPVYSTATFFPYGDVLGFQTGTQSPSPSYEPEFVVNREVGIELGFLKNRINFEATYFNQDNTDQIIGVQLSNTTGFTSALLNAASFVNKGVELDLKLTPLVKLGDVNIDLKMNYTYNTNEVTSIFGDVKELGIGNYNYAIVGQEVYKFKLTDYVRDDQGRVIVDKSTGMPSQNPNLTLFGNTMPKHFFGISLGANWKNLSFNAVADYRGGNQIVADQLGAFMDDNGISERSAQNGRRAFIFPNSVYDDGSGKYVVNTDVYTQNYGRLFWNSDLNTDVISNYVANGAFWKLREVSINYEIPTKIFGSKVGNVIKGANFGITGRNLLMWVPSSNKWTDPEFQGGNGNAAYTGNATGRSTAYNMPPTRIFGASLTLKF